MNALDVLLSSVAYSARAHRDETERLVNTVVRAKESGATAAQIAEAAGVSRSTVYRWLNSRGGGSDR